jgi:hypothetical protein
VDLFRNFIGIPLTYALPSPLNQNIGPIKNVEYFDNESSMEITFSNPDAATYVRHLHPPTHHF